MQDLLNIKTEDLPILWDADFLLRPKNFSGDDTYILCVINVSSVAPFAESATTKLAEAALIRTQIAKRQRLS